MKTIIIIGKSNINVIECYNDEEILITENKTIDEIKEISKNIFGSKSKIVTYLKEKTENEK